MGEIVSFRPRRPTLVVSAHCGVYRLGALWPDGRREAIDARATPQAAMDLALETLKFGFGAVVGPGPFRQAVAIIHNARRRCA
jgi:hypothetical protein